MPETKAARAPVPGSHRAASGESRTSQWHAACLLPARPRAASWPVDGLARCLRMVRNTGRGVLSPELPSVNDRSAHSFGAQRELATLCTRTDLPSELEDAQLRGVAEVHGQDREQAIIAGQLLFSQTQQPGERLDLSPEWDGLTDSGGSAALNWTHVAAGPEWLEAARQCVR